MDIKEALSQLDPLNDDHWTSDGAPRMDAIEAIVGDKSITRKDVVNAAPDFTREKAGRPSEDDDQSEAQENSGEQEQQQPNPDDEQGGANDQQDPDLDEQDQDEQDQDDAPELEIPTGLSEAEFFRWMLTVHPDNLLELEETLKDQINQIAQGIEQAKEVMARTRRAATATRQRISQVVPGSSNQEAIGDFIKAQAAARAAKVARRNEILKGVKPDELDPRAPIDAAMARKTKRGTQRPVRPILK